MPIHVPGVKRGRGKQKMGFKRDVVAVLQLTAMVDLFTVLVVFLLQNYAVTNQIFPINETIQLPQAQEVKELRPSHLVVISGGDVILNTESLGKLKRQTSKNQWVFHPLKTRILGLIKESQDGQKNFLTQQLEQLVGEKSQDLRKKAFFRVTIQADEDTPFFDIKKVLYTLTEAGVKEMNFAVVKLSTER